MSGKMGVMEYWYNGMTSVSIKHLLLILIFVLASGRLTGGETIAISDSVFSAKIERDEWGVPHIYGKRDADVSFGLAYAHAQDDYKTIEDVMFALRAKGENKEESYKQACEILKKLGINQENFTNLYCHQ